MVEIGKSEKEGFVVFTFINKLTNKLNTCEFNVKNSIPGLYPAIRDIIRCFDQYGIEIHNYTDKQDRLFQRALLTLTKEFTEFFGTFKQIKGADKKELLTMLTIDIYKKEISDSKHISADQKEILLSEILITIFEDILKKTIVSVLMFKDIVNETFSSAEFRGCMARYCCGSKKKKYLK